MKTNALGVALPILLAVGVTTSPDLTRSHAWGQSADDVANPFAVRQIPPTIPSSLPPQSVTDSPDRRALRIARAITTYPGFGGTKAISGMPPFLGRTYQASWGHSDAFGLIRLFPAKPLDSLHDVMAETVAHYARSCHGTLETRTLPMVEADYPLLRTVTLCQEGNHETVMHHLLIGDPSEFLEILISPRGDLDLATRWADSVARRVAGARLDEDEDE